MKIQIKPLSANEAYICKGKSRIKTEKYKKYIEDVGWQLKSMEIPDGELEISILVGFSNKASDLDNAAKPFIDILQKHYGFNDSRIYALTMLKTIVPKGEEFISFELFECFRTPSWKKGGENI